MVVGCGVMPTTCPCPEPAAFSARARGSSCVHTEVHTPGVTLWWCLGL